MALFGSTKDAEVWFKIREDSQKDWKEAKIRSEPQQDLFKCKPCKLDFGLESKKIKGKHITCPVCRKTLKAWQKGWEPCRY